ncbi:MAG: NADH-quinone oxidoreductase subunit NuoE [Nitrospirota bacterium]|jgi:NADH-quinone oxidoreductase subunit E
MLTEEEKEEIRKSLKDVVHKREAVSDALKVVQRHRGWISGELPEVAEMLGMSPAEVDSIATFYSLIFRRPVGKHVILLCDSFCCWIMGYREVFEHLSTRLGVGFGETTEDGQFTLLPVCCIGACGVAPAMMVDEELYGDLTPEKIDSILEDYK